MPVALFDPHLSTPGPLIVDVSRAVCEEGFFRALGAFEPGRVVRSVLCEGSPVALKYAVVPVRPERNPILNLNTGWRPGFPQAGHGSSRLGQGIIMMIRVEPKSPGSLPVNSWRRETSPAPGPGRAGRGSLARELGRDSEH